MVPKSWLHFSSLEEIDAEVKRLKFEEAEARAEWYAAKLETEHKLKVVSALIRKRATYEQLAHHEHLRIDQLRAKVDSNRPH